MQFALVNNQKTFATPHTQGLCPICKQEVISKCGDINIHHWAHKIQECDVFSEPESLWHRKWKSLLPPHQTEVTIQNHRADIVKKDGTVIELQHSTIPPQEIIERENFYNDMAWLFDGTDLEESGLLDLRPQDDYYSFRWKHARKHYSVCQKPVFIDLDDYIFLLRKIHLGPPCGGWGNIIQTDDFIKWLLEEPKKKISKVVRYF